MTWDRYKPRGASHGSTHAQARKTWALRHQPCDPCARCGQPLGPMGPWLHLDHHDEIKWIYLGFSHAACNLTAAGQLGRQRQRQPPTQRAPRDWT